MADEFVLMQIWISDRSIRPLDREQAARMKKEFGTESIPLHVIVDSDGRELARFVYDPAMTAEDYTKFLDAGLAKFRK